ncbi:Ank-2 multi-domain protein [Pyrenophora tritici-repentis]|nr:Ank-2 multi-domain protein [Pyrenophora tritici-repentis]
MAGGADLNNPGALLAAVSQSMEILDIVLTAFRGRYPTGGRGFFDRALRKAIREKNETIIRKLAEHADLNDTEWLDVKGEVKHRTSERTSDIFTNVEYLCLPTLLREGIATRSVNIVKILLDSGGNPDSTVEMYPNHSLRGRVTAISKAISTGDLAMVKLLHDANANLHFSATLGITHTSLHLAVELGHADIVEYLLDRDVDVNAPPCTFEGGTALQFAAKVGSVGTAELLIQHGAIVNAPGSTYGGQTAFEFAAEFGRMDMLLLLFHKGVDLVSDGGAQIRRACKSAEENGQVAARDLVMQLAEAKGMDVFAMGGYNTVGSIGNVGLPASGGYDFPSESLHGSDMIAI